MQEYPDLELIVNREGSAYQVKFCLGLPGSDADRQESAHAAIDPVALTGLLLDPRAYGQALGKQLLGEPAAWAAFSSARAAAQGAPLRVRLSIDTSAAELHSLWWETLRDPETGALLFSGEGLVFSRYLSSRDWQPVPPRSRSDLKALANMADE